MNPVRIERHDGIATVTLDDGNANRVGREMAEGLRVAALKLSDAPPQAVILRGTTCFSAGLATNEDAMFQPFEQLVQNRDAFRAQELVTRYRNAMDGFARLPCLIVAAIDGPCVGPALALALTADIRLATTGATFGVTDLTHGVIPGFGALTRLAAVVGADRITDAVLTNRHWDATEALSLGIVHELVADGEAYNAAKRTIGQVAANPPNTQLQALLLLRCLRSDPSNNELESQSAARTWIRGEWQKK